MHVSKITNPFVQLIYTNKIKKKFLKITSKNGKIAVLYKNWQG
jgi:hypothetical protein